MYIFDTKKCALVQNIKLDNSIEFVSKVKVCKSKIYVLYTTKSELVEHDGEFQQLRSIKLKQCVTTSDAPMTSFCIDPQNNLILAVSCTHGLVSVFSLTSGMYLGQWSATTRFHWPIDVDICDVTGGVYIADHRESRVYSYDS